LAVIIKGRSVAGAGRLEIHLTRVDENERVEIREFRGVASENLHDALHDMEALAAGTRAEKPFYHASINTLASERLTEEQRAHAIETLEKKLGLTGQPRIVVVHEKKDREHTHIVWSRIDLEHMRAISDSHNFRKHEEVARELEREFGLARVQGAHAEREGVPRPKRTPSHAEMLQAQRTGLTPQQVTEQVTALWRTTDNDQSFAAALSDAGYVLARGDRRDFVVIDPHGGTHSLARCVEGARTKEIRARMADLEPSVLPSVAMGKQMQLDRRDLSLAQARDQAQQARLEDENKPKPGGADKEWTDRGGMVEQQTSAMKWVKEQEYKAARTEQTDRKQERRDGDEALAQRRQALLREFGRNVENELDPSDLDRTQERTRR
jgi:hypothetical protein